MRPKKSLCIAALVLMVMSLALVSLDFVLSPGETSHKPGQCPVCSWAHHLASSVAPCIVVWTEDATRCWTPPDRISLVVTESFFECFSARAPPLSSMA